MNSLDNLKEELGHYADYAAVKVADEYDRYMKRCAKVIFDWLRRHEPEDPQKSVWEFADVAAIRWLEAISLYDAHEFLKRDIEKAVSDFVETTNCVFRVDPLGRLELKK